MINTPSLSMQKPLLNSMLPSGEFIWARESVTGTCVWLILSTHRSLLSCQWFIHFVCDQRFIAHRSLLFPDLPLSCSVWYRSPRQHSCSRTDSASHWASLVLCSYSCWQTNTWPFSLFFSLSYGPFMLTAIYSMEVTKSLYCWSLEGVSIAGCANAIGGLRNYIKSDYKWDEQILTVTHSESQLKWAKPRDSG